MTPQEREQLKDKLATNPKYQTDSVSVGQAAAKQVEEPAPQATDNKSRKTITNWNVFYEAGLTPTAIKCEGYYPLHPFNSGCHTTMQLKPSQLANHVEPHGGGFFISFKENYANNPDSNIVRAGKPWEGWKEFEQLGLELKDLRCNICDEEVKLTVRSIHRHCKAHTGKSSRLKPGGDFWLTLSYDAPLEFGDEEN